MVHRFSVAAALLIAGFAGSSPSAAQTAAVGSITGHVRDAEGRPVAHALVIAYMRYSSGGDSTPVLTSVETAVDGGYSFPRLGPGSYLICAQVEGQPLLNPCEWSAQPPAWNLRPSESATVDVVMARGVYVDFRVSDTDRELVATRQRVNKDADDPPYRIAIVTRRQAINRLSVLAWDSGGENLRAVVPPDTEVEYLLETKGIRMVDRAGKELGSSGRATQRQVLRTENRDKAVRLSARKP